MLFEKTIYPDDFPLNIQIIQVDEIPFHYHQDVELVYVLKGEIRLKNGYYNYLLKEGDIFTNSGHEVHGLRATDSDNVIAVIQKNFQQCTSGIGNFVFPQICHKYNKTNTARNQKPDSR